MNIRKQKKKKGERGEGGGGGGTKMLYIRSLYLIILIVTKDIVEQR